MYGRNKRMQVQKVISLLQCYSKYAGASNSNTTLHSIKYYKTIHKLYRVKFLPQLDDSELS